MASGNEFDKSFRELKVWQKAIELTASVYRITAEFPKSEIYGLTSQMRRASISIASNIAEGSARSTNKDYRYFLAIARGSCFELQTQIVITARVGFASQARLREAELLSQEIGRMLTGLSKYLTKPKAA